MSRNRRRPRPAAPLAAPAVEPAPEGAPAKPNSDSLRDAVRAALEAKTGVPVGGAAAATGAEQATGNAKRKPPSGGVPSNGPNPGRVGGGSGAGRGFRPLPRRTG